MSDFASDTRLFTGDFLELRRKRHWEYVRRPRSNGGAAFMIATTEAEELVLVEQFRIPVDRRVIELPAGIMGDEDPDETPEQAAVRELEEETGFRASQVKALFDAPTAAGMSSEWSYFLRLWGLDRVHAGGGVGDEDITTHCVPIATAPAWLKQQSARGLAVDPRIFAALFWLNQESAG